jgi:hypothetical protein
MRRPDLMSPLRLRRFTAGERALCEEVFASELDSDRVRILSVPVWRRPFVPGGRLIVWPASSAMADFAEAPLWLKSVLLHELVHVWQAQGGVFLPTTLPTAVLSPSSISSSRPWSCSMPIWPPRAAQRPMGRRLMQGF